jgi:HSP90 family molecular chaperone
MTELSLDLVKSQVPKHIKEQITPEVLDEIHKLAENPDYGEEFLETYKDCLIALEESPKTTHRRYLNAVKFYTLVESGHSLTDAYCLTFPERFEQRTRNSNESPEKKKQMMRGEASRFNSSRTVNELRLITQTPVQLIHRHLLHDAILQTADLMRSAKSEMVRQKAADTLIRELKPAEENTLRVKVDDGASSAIEELRKASQELAAEQRKAALAGVPVKQIAAARIFDDDEDDIIDVEPDPVPDLEDELPDEEPVVSSVPRASSKWSLRK